mmetsp:Transcript_20977/g.36790  ORF Transcript_20977/g.36790 Transcript_20977/m.36790 type:complete len:1017 (+) Transcript_20977:69-3119(+)
MTRKIAVAHALPETAKERGIKIRLVQGSILSWLFCCCLCLCERSGTAGNLDQKASNLLKNDFLLPASSVIQPVGWMHVGGEKSPGEFPDIYKLLKASETSEKDDPPLETESFCPKNIYEQPQSCLSGGTKKYNMLRSKLWLLKGGKGPGLDNEDGSPNQDVIKAVCCSTAGGDGSAASATGAGVEHVHHVMLDTTHVQGLVLRPEHTLAYVVRCWRSHLHTLQDYVMAHSPVPGPDLLAALLCNDVPHTAEEKSEQTVLMLAVECEQVGTVRALLDAGAWTNQKDSDGASALHYAACVGHTEIMKILLSRGAMVDLQDGEGASALHYAARDGHSEVLKILLSAGAEVDFQCKDGRTALHVAAWGGHVAVAKILLGAGAQVNSQDRSGMSALMFAACTGNMEITKFLLGAGGQAGLSDSNGATALHHAVLGGHVELVKFFWRAGVDVDGQDRNGNTPLHVAAINCQTKVVSVLLNAGAQIDLQNNEGQTVLHLAASYGQVDAVAALVGAGALVDQQDHNENSALHFASASGQPEVAKFLLNAGAQADLPDHDGNTALHLAALYGRTEVVSLLLASGAKFNHRDKYGQTALMKAALGAKVLAVQLLISAGAQINIQDKDGNTALHQVVIGSTVRSWFSIGVQIMVKKVMCDMHTLDFLSEPCMNTIKMDFSSEPYMNTIKVLGDAGIQLDRQNKLGLTALHLAAFGMVDADLLMAILNAGAKTNVQDNQGNTALHLAASHGDLEDNYAAYSAVAVLERLPYANDDKFLPEDDKSPLSTIFPDMDDIFPNMDIFDDVPEVEDEEMTQFLTKAKDMAQLDAPNELLEEAFAQCNAKLEKEQTEKVKLLLGAEVAPDLQNSCGDSALHIAAFKGHLKVVELLLAAGAWVDLQEGELKLTALHLAASEGHADVVDVLLAAGALPDLQDEDCYTALHLAKNNGHVNVVEVFQNFSAAKNKTRRKTGKQSACKCLVCNKRPINRVVVPCGHMAVCDACASKSLIHECPVCQKPATQIIQTFGVV